MAMLDDIDEEEKKEEIRESALEQAAQNLRPGETYVDPAAVMIDIDKITFYPRNPRTETITDDSVKDLVESILSNGLLSPLLIRKQKIDGKHWIIGGNRRFKAILLINASDEVPEKKKIKQVPVRFIDAETEEDVDILVIADNLDTVPPDSEPFREMVLSLGERYNELKAIGEESVTKKKFIERILATREMSDRQIRRYTTIITKADPRILDASKSGSITLKVAEEISSLDEGAQQYLADLIEKGDDITSSRVSELKELRLRTEDLEKKNKALEARNMIWEETNRQNEERREEEERQSKRPAKKEKEDLSLSDEIKKRFESRTVNEDKVGVKIRNLENTAIFISKNMDGIKLSEEMKKRINNTIEILKNLS